MIDKKLSEGIHFDIIPAPEDGNAWHIRIMEEYPETVIQFGAVEFDGKTDMLHFNMEIISSPDTELTTEDLTFQEYCARILSEVIELSLENGTVVAQDLETGQVAATEDMIETLEELVDEFGEDSSQYVGDI
jgi:hypothetical protein